RGRGLGAGDLRALGAVAGRSASRRRAPGLGRRARSPPVGARAGDAVPPPGGGGHGARPPLRARGRALLRLGHRLPDRVRDRLGAHRGRRPAAGAPRRRRPPGGLGEPGPRDATRPMSSPSPIIEQPGRRSPGLRWRDHGVTAALWLAWCCPVEALARFAAPEMAARIAGSAPGASLLGEAFLADVVAAAQAAGILVTCLLAWGTYGRWRPPSPQPSPSRGEGEGAEMRSLCPAGK